MKHRRTCDSHLVRVAAALAFAVTVPNVARALSVAPMTPLEVAAAANTVVVATVVTIDRVEAPNHVAEVVELRVEDVWKGAGEATLRCARLVAVPASPPRLWATVEGIAPLDVGGTYLFFLDTTSDAPRLPLTVGDVQGLFRAERSEDGWRFSTLDGAPVVGVSTERLALRREGATEMRPGEGVVSSRPVEVHARGLEVTWRHLVASTGVQR